MRILLKILLILIATGIFVGCNGTTDEPEVPVTPPDSVKRTILVYMVADNSLGSYSYDESDLSEMLAAAKKNGLNGCRFLIYHHARRKAPVMRELTDTGFVDHKTYTYDTSIYSVDPERMEEVIKDSRTIAPAHDYGLVLWSHGNGWAESSGTRQSPVLKSFGDDRGYKMSVSTLANVLDGKGFSFIYFDCCHMSTVEVAYELRHATPVIVGSTAEIPAPGMDYRLNVPVFVADEPDMVKAASNTFHSYDMLIGSDRTCTMSVIRTAGLDRLAEATRAIMQTAPEGPLRSHVQRFMLASCTIYDFGDYITKLSGVDPLLLDRWQKALDDVVVYKAATPYIWNQIRIDTYSGLGSWVMEGPGDEQYMIGNTNTHYDHTRWWTDVVSANPLFSQSDNN